MAEEIKKVIDIDTTKSTKSIKQLREQVAGLTDELESLEIGSSDYSKKLEELVSAQNKLNVATESMQGKTVNAVKAFDSINQVAGGLAGGVSAVSAAFTLFGRDTENLQKTMVKLQAAIAIVQGIGGLKGLGEGVLNGVKSFKALSVAITGTSVAMNGFKAALVSTGIGALLVAVGLLIDKLTSLKDEAKLTSDEIENIRQRNENLRTQAKESFWEEEYNSLIKLNPELKDEIENVIKATDAYKELSKVGAAVTLQTFEEREAKAFLKDIIELDKAFRNALTAYDKDLLSIGTRFGKTEEEISELFKNTLSRQQFLKKVTGKDVKEARLELQRVSESLADNTKYLDETKNPLRDYQNLVKTGNKILEDRKKAEEEAARARKQALDKLQDEIKTKKAAIDKYWSDNEKTLLSETDRENLILKENYQLQLNDLKWLLDKKELTQEEYRKRLKQINDAYDKEYLDNQNERYRKEINNRINSLEQLRERENRFFDQRQSELDTKYNKTYTHNAGLGNEYKTAGDIKSEKNDRITQSNELLEIQLGFYERDNKRIGELQTTLKESFDNGLITQEEYNNEYARLNAEREANDTAAANAIVANGEKIKAAKKDEIKDIVAAVQGSFAALGSLGDAVAQNYKFEANNSKKSLKEREKAMENYKSIAKISTVFNTASAAMNAYNSMAGIPVVGPVLGGIAAAAAIAMGLLQIKNIENEEISGSDVSSSVSAPSALTQAPVEYTRNLLGNKETDELNNPVKCYVVESDITSAQTKVAVTESNASF